MSPLTVTAVCHQKEEEKKKAPRSATTVILVSRFTQGQVT